MSEAPGPRADGLAARLASLGRPYLLLVAVQTLALGGNALTGFALGVWLFQAERRAMPFAWLQIVSTLPLLVVLPWAGSVADRCDRRRVVLASAGVVLAATVALAGVLAAGVLALWQVYLFGFVTAVAGAFQRPAFGALAAALLPREQAARGGGLTGLSHDVVTLAAPLAAGALTAQLGLAGVVTIDLLLYALAAALLLRLFPALAVAARPAASRLAPPDAGWARTAWRDFAGTLAWLHERPLLAGLTGYVVLQGALVSLVGLLVAPLILSRFDSTALGLVMTLGGVGAALGSGALIVVGQRRRLMASLLAADALLAAGVLGAGFATTIPGYAACAIVAFGAAAAAHGYAAALWILTVPDERRGRLYACIGTLGLIVGPVLAAAGAALADRVFAGSARGIEIVFMLAGSAGLVLALVGLAQPRFRALDAQLPDG